MLPLLEANKLDLPKVVWLCKNEEELFQFSGHFKIFAELLKYRSGLSSVAEAIN